MNKQRPVNECVIIERLSDFLRSLETGAAVRQSILRRIPCSCKGCGCLRCNGEGYIITRETFVGPVL